MRERKKDRKIWWVGGIWADFGAQKPESEYILLRKLIFKNT